ncbi:hypothetical protein [Clostridium thermosuccinogenes]|jgi:hypothetical protein|uniref:hypothetical protein n=1 Tax=Clostridium thermosuccinogenes TaxID=84032 RepID=UPI000CCC98C5|nr:hypothetical protein [Pseudoclostridium thermosuccinogenes]PNT90242.1 hypothetical protein CDQ83_19995 [Pseudoclostridium thermosuccinogenes]
MKRKEIIEILREMSPLQIENNGPTVIYIADECGKKAKSFVISGSIDSITVTTGKYLLKRKYRISRNEL